MHGGLAVMEAIEVFASPADSVLRLIRNQKCMSRITDSAIFVSETNKTLIATTPYLGVRYNKLMVIYFKHFLIKDVLSALFSSVLMITLVTIFRTYQLYDSYYILSTLSITVPLALSHYFYFIEHDLVNDFFGRLIHDVLIIGITVFLSFLYLSSVEIFHKIGFLSNLITIIAIVVFISEILISLIHLIFIRPK